MIRLPDITSYGMAIENSSSCVKASRCWRRNEIVQKYFVGKGQG